MQRIAQIEEEPEERHHIYPSPLQEKFMKPARSKSFDDVLEVQKSQSTVPVFRAGARGGVRKALPTNISTQNSAKHTNEVSSGSTGNVRGTIRKGIPSPVTTTSTKQLNDGDNIASLRTKTMVSAVNDDFITDNSNSSTRNNTLTKQPSGTSTLDSRRSSSSSINSLTSDSKSVEDDKKKKVSSLRSATVARVPNFGSSSSPHDKLDSSTSVNSLESQSAGGARTRIRTSLGNISIAPSLNTQVSGSSTVSMRTRASIPNKESDSDTVSLSSQQSSSNILPKSRNYEAIGNLIAQVPIHFQLKAVLETPEVKQKYMQWLKANMCDENILFYDAVEDFKTANTSISKAEAIFTEFISYEGSKSLNIDSKLRKETMSRYENLTPRTIKADFYDNVQKNVFEMMAQDSMFKFSRTTPYMDLVEDLNFLKFEDKPRDEVTASSSPQ